MDLMNYMDFDDFSRQPFPQMIKQIQNLQSIIVYDYTRYFVVRKYIKIKKYERINQ